MKLNIKGKNINVYESLKEEAKEKFDRLDKYFNKEEEMDLKFSTEGNLKKVESTIFLKGGTILRAEEVNENFSTGIDKVIDALVRQIRKHKTKLQRNRRNGESIKFESFDNIEIEEDKEDSPTIKKEKEIVLRPMSDEEACMQMELLNHDFFIYLDDQEMKTRLVYKRKDGHYGLIIPE